LIQLTAGQSSFYISCPLTRTLFSLFVVIIITGNQGSKVKRSKMNQKSRQPTMGLARIDGLTTISRTRITRQQQFFLMAEIEMDSGRFFFNLVE
jgi:hypothetical protein